MIPWGRLMKGYFVTRTCEKDLVREIGTKQLQLGAAPWQEAIKK